MINLLCYAFSIVSIILLYILIKIFNNTYNSLYLVSNESIIDDQTLIPVSGFSNKKLNKKEDIIITLSDLEGTRYVYQIGFSKWSGYFFWEINGNSSSKFNNETIDTNKKYKIKKHSVLNLNGREFNFIFTPKLLLRKEHF